MENIEEKYKKLATEYSKLRAQAGVLKRAVLEEQNKNLALRETMRIKETNLRRLETEVDNTVWVNKQLEHRVANLQDDLNNVGKNSKSKGKLLASNDSPAAHQSHIEPSSVLSEEFQKKIFECAQLTSSLADKSAEMQLQSNRIEELENLIRSMNAEQTDIEAKLRKDVERLTVKMHDMETKYTEASSIVGSDDTLYVSDCEQQQQQQQKFNNNTHNNFNMNHNGKVEKRIAELEKEVIHWRSQCEILKVTDKLKSFDGDSEKIENQTTEKIETEKELTPRELMIIEHFSKKVEELFRNRCISESKLAVLMDECDSLRKHLDIVNDDLKFQDRKYRESQRNLQLADEDLATTRINYEEQISVLTEQVISLSDQLADLK